MTARANFSFNSSVDDDVWHPSDAPGSYEWWYFDALADNGRDGVVVIFLDNFIFSPRYNSHGRKKKTVKEHFPAIAFFYYRNGKAVYRSINELAPESFSASRSLPHCKIGENNFKLESLPYGTGFTVAIDGPLTNNRRVKADFEWLSIESNFMPQKTSPEAGHKWNLVASRSDVTGKIVVTGKDSRETDVVNFRGTGYHDHNSDTRWMPVTVRQWQWGRAHFPNATVIFYRYAEVDSDVFMTKLFLITGGSMEKFDAEFVRGRKGRNKFGLGYPRSFTLRAGDNIELTIEQNTAIDSSFFYLRFLSNARLRMGAFEGETAAITEHLAPKALKYRWLDWLINMRIGRNGKGSFLP
jgi:carotenoid 1,2-hydratase